VSGWGKANAALAFVPDFMNSFRNSASRLLAVLAVTIPTIASAVVVAPQDFAKALADAQAFRAAMVGNVSNGSQDPATALRELSARANASGFGIDGSADFAFAAVDIGRRLIALHKPVEAEAFFQSAESALTAVIDRTSDALAKEKVQYLETRSGIRAEFLNKLSEARSDLDAALKISPDDKRLQQRSRLLTADPATTLQTFKNQPIKG
jgi:hypothetical protein